MSHCLLDTSAYSAFKRGHPAIADRVRSASLLHVNPIVLGELQAGFLQGGRLEKNLKELDEFLASPRVSILPVDEETARHYAEVVNALKKAGRPIPTNDIWIAASAMQYHLQLVTTDRDFLAIPELQVEFFSLPKPVQKPGRRPPKP